VAYSMGQVRGWGMGEEGINLSAWSDGCHGQCLLWLLLPRALGQF
jgi:hypothetical protein